MNISLSYCSYEKKNILSLFLSIVTFIKLYKIARMHYIAKIILKLACAQENNHFLVLRNNLCSEMRERWRGARSPIAQPFKPTTFAREN